jgi:hypothetical protein
VGVWGVASSTKPVSLNEFCSYLFSLFKGVPPKLFRPHTKTVATTNLAFESYTETIKPQVSAKFRPPAHIGGRKKIVEVLGSDPSPQKLANQIFFKIRPDALLDVPYTPARDQKILMSGYRAIWL